MRVRPNSQLLLRGFPCNPQIDMSPAGPTRGEAVDNAATDPGKFENGSGQRPNHSFSAEAVDRRMDVAGVNGEAHFRSHLLQSSGEKSLALSGRMEVRLETSRLCLRYGTGWAIKKYLLSRRLILCPGFLSQTPLPLPVSREGGEGSRRPGDLPDRRRGEGVRTATAEQ
jgi:hypothetical protein